MLKLKNNHLLKSYFTLTAPRQVIWLLVLIPLFSFVIHPYYMSVTEIKYQDTSKTLQLSVKLFTSDIENTLKTLGNTRVDLLNDKYKSESEQLLNDYISSRLNISINSKTVNYHLIGFEPEEEAIWVYFESDKTEKPNRIDVSCTLLYEQLPQQINIIHTEIGDQKQSTKLANPDSKTFFTY